MKSNSRILELLLLGMLLMQIGCGATPTSNGDSPLPREQVGSATLKLELPGGIPLTEVTARIVGVGYEQVRMIDVAADDAVVSIYFAHVPVGDRYRVQLSAAGCTGETAEFSVLEDQTTNIEVRLQCTGADESESVGSVNVNGVVDITAGRCDPLQALAVSPSIQVVGGAARSTIVIETKPEFGPATVVWPTIDGLEGTSAAGATFVCKVPGAVTIAPTISTAARDAGPACSRTLGVTVQCLPRTVGPDAENCHNDVIDDGEACEPSLPLPSGGSCSAIDPTLTGQASCTQDCRWSLQQCERLPTVCGDGKVERLEECEPGRPAIACSTVSHGYSAGDVTCRADCTLDLSACVAIPDKCGNGVVEGVEACDDGNTNDDDACGNDCWARIDGEPALYEGPPLGTVGRDAFLDPGSVCADREVRNRYAAPTVVEVQYVALVCNRTGGPNPARAYTDVQVRQAMSRVNTDFIQQSNIRLIEHAIVPYDDEDCVIDYDSIFAVGDIIRHGQPFMIPIVFVSQISSRTSRTGIGGYAREGEFAVIGSTSTEVIAHELGHFFGLNHTHDCDLGVETASTCFLTGDMLCDTPPDRGPDAYPEIQRCNPNSGSREGRGMCPIACGNSACLDGTVPDRTNFMGYYHSCRDSFSPDQSAFMRCQLGDGRLSRFNFSDSCPGIPETCNGIDDDCDDEIDEEVTRPCGSNVGECSAGIQRCVTGNWLSSCEASTGPRQEVCDGRDNNCNGEIDDGVDPNTEPVSQRCPDLGVCANGAASLLCTGTGWRCQYPSNYVNDECPVVNPACGANEYGSITDPTCRDGLDNDCDGAQDEHNIYPLCEVHPNYSWVTSGRTCFASTVGRCGSRGGSYACVQLSDGCGISVDCQGATFPEAEQCDGQDWDCDGRVDDRNDSDNDGYGDCAGSLDCSPGNPAIHPGAHEECNGIDDNCDLQADETFECGPGRVDRACNVCGNVGQQLCTLSSCSFERKCSVGTVPLDEGYWEGNHPALGHNYGQSCNSNHWCAITDLTNPRGNPIKTHTTYGPYVTLGPASYSVQFRGSCSGGQNTFEVYDATSGQILVSDRRTCDFFSQLFDLPLSFPIPKENACHAIEFRVFSEIGWPAGVELLDIRLRRLTQFEL